MDRQLVYPPLLDAPMRLSILLAVGLMLAACQNTPTEAASDPSPVAANELAAEGMTPEAIEAEANMPTALVSDAMPAEGPTRLAEGAFSGASGHDVSGTAILYRLDDGAHLVRLEGLDADNGPDLEVWLVRRTSGDVGAGGLSLGDLKSTNGDQNYAVPAGTELADYAGVSVWCRRFGVNFGTAPLDAE